MTYKGSYSTPSWRTPLRGGTVEPVAEEDPIWEACAGCGKEFLFPHLCREHMLCGICHPPGGMAQPRSSTDTDKGIWDR